MRSGVVVLFGLTSFLAAALLFSAEPMIGKMILPVLGGTPAVWNTCLVYFQVMLLGGYLFAHGVNFRKAANRSRVGVSYLSLLAVLLTLGYVLQPIAIVPGVFLSSIERNPTIVLLGILTVSATLPLLMVSATAPLLQCWFALAASSPRERSVFPLCREQCRQPDGASGLSALDRAGFGFAQAEPGLADWVSASGNSGSDLWCHRSPLEWIAGHSKRTRRALAWDELELDREKGGSCRSRSGPMACPGLHSLELADGRDNLFDD